MVFRRTDGAVEQTEVDGCICIAHQIGSTDSQSDASLGIMVENIIRTRDGEPPVNQVDKKLRY